MGQPQPEVQARWHQSDGSSTRRQDVLDGLRTADDTVPPDLRGISLIDEDLAGVKLSGCDLRGADLSRANLKGADLSFCNLTDAILFQAELEGCNLLGANLNGATMNECSAPGTTFGSADLSNVSLVGADLQRATFSKGTLRHAVFSSANLRGARMREVDLSEASFARSDMREVDLTSSKVAGVRFSGADLRGAQLKGLQGFAEATWVGADIREVDFCGAYMIRRHIADENYIHEMRTQSRASEIIYGIWWLTSDCGRSALRWAACTMTVNLMFAGLYVVAGMDFGADSTWLTPIYFSTVTFTTLGYGDITPTTSLTQIIVMVEVTLGYIALGGLLSIFANKMARRAD
jgi:uncharacterized protein YjbI with pentapeptide repeats